ncbi:NUDIX domain-containing protein [Sphingosinicella sp. BN140058]|uniref:NUDIX domain-containing protein n=1 Tax=Sphingosinicella sp. BN140058 TaxID=1892855 RepID=UPI001013170D|nr:NUDIX domain-containing protein [Sphingosinicella sp. BN140058]QAY80382.1 hypothetical protein ETR14_27465 [Sphingosinicella sp. BN140058]
MNKIEHIVALPASAVAAAIGLGFDIRAFEPAAAAALFASGAVVGPRALLEESPDYIQLIPYLVGVDGDQVLSYVRSKKGGEARLHKKISVGVGGHVDVEDAVARPGHTIDLSELTGDQIRPAGAIDIERTLAIAALRELCEELKIQLPADFLDRHPDLLKYTHIVHSQKSPVDAVHLGFVVKFDLAVLAQKEFECEDALANVRMQTPEQMLEADAIEGDDRLPLENWALFVLNQIVADRKPLAA